MHVGSVPVQVPSLVQYLSLFPCNTFPSVHLYTAEDPDFVPDWQTRIDEETFSILQALRFAIIGT